MLLESRGTYIGCHFRWLKIRCLEPTPFRIRFKILRIGVWSITWYSSLLKSGNSPPDANFDKSCLPLVREVSLEAYAGTTQSVPRSPERVLGVLPPD